MLPPSIVKRLYSLLISPEIGFSKLIFRNILLAFYLVLSINTKVQSGLKVFFGEWIGEKAKECGFCCCRGIASRKVIVSWLAEEYLRQQAAGCNLIALGVFVCFRPIF